MRRIKIGLSLLLTAVIASAAWLPLFMVSSQQTDQALTVLFRGNEELLECSPANINSVVIDKTPGKNALKLSDIKDGYIKFSASLEGVDKEDIGGFAFFMDSESTGGGNTVAPMFGWSGLTQTGHTYYTLTETGVWSEHTSSWKHLSLDGFRGWVILPIELYTEEDQLNFSVDKWTQAIFQFERSAAGDFILENFGYYKDLAALKNELSPSLNLIEISPENMLGGDITANVVAGKTPSGKGYELSYDGNSSYSQFAFPVPAGDAKGIVFWMKADATGQSCTFAPGMGWDSFVSNKPYFTLTAEGEWTQKTTEWKYLREDGFTGWVIIPAESYASFNLSQDSQFIVMMGDRGGAAQKILLDHIGYYSSDNLTKLKNELLSLKKLDDEKQEARNTLIKGDEFEQFKTIPGLSQAARISPSGEAFKLNFKSGERAFGLNKLVDRSHKPKGMLMWISVPKSNENSSAPDSTGILFTLTTKEGHNYVVENKDYYLIDQDGNFSTAKANNRRVILEGFEGWLLIPEESYVYNWGGSGSKSCNLADIVGVQFYLADKLSEYTFWFESLGYYTDLEKVKSELSVVAKYDLNFAIEDNQDAYNAGSAFFVSGWSGFKTAFENAVVVFESDNTTRQEVVTAKEALLTAREGLVSTVNKAQLEASVNNAKAKYDLGELYFRSGFGEFKTAYEAAAAVMDNVAVVQSDVDGAKTDLDEALGALVEEFTSMVELKKAFGDKGYAKTAYENGKDYYREGWDEFSSQYTLALAVRNNPNATEAESENALNRLTLAYKALRRLAPNINTEENVGMQVINDGSTLNMGVGYFHNATVELTANTPDGSGMKVKVNAVPTEYNFDTYFPEDLDLDTIKGLVLWVSTPAIAANPMHLWTHTTEGKHYRTSAGSEYYTLSKSGEFKIRDVGTAGTLLGLEGFTGWVIVPENSIEYIWGGAATPFENFQLKLLSAVGFSTSGEDAAGTEMLVDDIAVYGDLKDLVTKMGIDYDNYFGNKDDDEEPIETDDPEGGASQKANDKWQIIGDGYYNSGYGSITGLKSGSIIRVPGVPLSDGTNEKITVNVRADTTGIINVYASQNGANRVKIAVINVTESAFAAEDFEAFITRSLIGVYDIEFEFAEGLSGDFYEFTFSGSYSGNIPDTSDLIPVAALAALTLLFATMAVKTRRKNV